MTERAGSGFDLGPGPDLGLGPDPGPDLGPDLGPGPGHDVVGFARALRDAGLPIGVAETEAFAQALTWIDPLVRREVYLAARATLVRRREDLAVFDELFAKFFGGPSLGRGQVAPRTTGCVPATTHGSRASCI